MKVHTDLKELLADFSIYHHRWLLTKDDKRTFTELTDDYLSVNSLALGKPEPLAKNKQGENNFYCNYFERGKISAKCSEPCGVDGCVIQKL